MVKTRLRSLPLKINLFSVASFSDDKTVILSGGASSEPSSDEPSAKVCLIDIVNDTCIKVADLI